MTETRNLSNDIDRRIRAGRISFKHYKRELHNRPKASLLPLKARMVRPEVVEALLYGCATWTLVKGHYTKLRTAHHRMLLRILGAWRKSPNKRILSHKDALQRTECESIETTVRMRRLLWSGALLRMGDYRLAKRVMSGELENAGKRGTGVKEKEWTDCVAKDLRLFGITGDWSTVALDPGAWYGTVREGGCGFMPAWVKEEEYASALQCGKLTENLQVPSSSPHKRGKVPAVDDVAVVTTAAATAAVDATEIGPPGGDRWCRGGCLPHPPPAPAPGSANGASRVAGGTRGHIYVISGSDSLSKSSILPPP